MDLFSLEAVKTAQFPEADEKIWVKKMVFPFGPQFDEWSLLDSRDC